METNKDRAQRLLDISGRADKWKTFYLGAGCAFSISEYALYVIFNHLTILSFCAIISFAMVLLNIHVRDWAKKKAKGLSNE